MEILVVWEPVPEDFHHASLTHWELEHIRQITAKFLQNQLPDLNLNFDSTQRSRHELLAVALGMFLSVSSHELLQISWIEILDFILDVEHGYRCNPYHSFKHAIDVMFVVYHIITAQDASRFFCPLDLIILLASAIAHDISHPGLNNLYQVNGKTDLAVLYGEKSVLERYSISHTQSLLRKHNILRNLTHADYTFFVDSLESTILSTDMVSHFDLISEFSDMISSLLIEEKNAVGSSMTSEIFDSEMPVTIQLPLSVGNRKSLMKFLLHGADISNPCRPWTLCKKWSDLVVQEFFMQGDVEKRFGLPISPNMDRDSSDQAEISIGFGDVIVKPYFELICQFIPESKEFLVHLENNRQNWIELKKSSQKEKQLKPPNIGIHESTSSPEVSIKNYGISESAHDNLQHLRANMLGRRLSVAAGVITVPENLPLLPKSSRKISFEYADQAAYPSKCSSARQSTATLHSILRVRLGDGKTAESKSSLSSSIELEKQFGALAFDSSTNTNDSGASSDQVFRRTSMVSTDDEAGLLKFVIKRRNSQIASSSSLPQSESFVRTRNEIPTSMSRSPSFPKKSSRHSRDNSNEASDTSDRKESFISPSIVPNTSTKSSKAESMDQLRLPDHIENPRKLSRPQSYLHQVLLETRVKGMKNMMLRSKIENIMLPRDIPNRESVLASILPRNYSNDGNYRTVHRSDKIYEHLMHSRRKTAIPAFLLFSKDDEKDAGVSENSLHFVHAGEVQVAARAKSVQTQPPSIPNTTNNISTPSPRQNLEAFDRVTQTLAANSGRSRAISDANLNHRRAVSDGLVVNPSMLERIKENMKNKKT